VIPPAFLSRARLRRDPPLAALAPVLLPADENHRIGTAHRLLWTLFADDLARNRDFLWREMDGERLDRLAFLILSARPPEDRLGLFELDPPKPWVPALRPSDRPGYALRANPVVTTRAEERRHGTRHDVVMHRLHAVPGAERGAARPELIAEAGRAWLAAQGERHGFTLLGAPRVDGYVQRCIPREAGPPVRFSTLNLEGVLEITDPQAFVAAVLRGFGKAKAWGCGLMLIRRVP
jgi:CRISPR system Cascade subunit CasE